MDRETDSDVMIISSILHLLSCHDLIVFLLSRNYKQMPRKEQLSSAPSHIRDGISLWHP